MWNFEPELLAELERKAQTIHAKLMREKLARLCLVAHVPFDELPTEAREWFVDLVKSAQIFWPCDEDD